MILTPYNFQFPEPAVTLMGRVKTTCLTCFVLCLMGCNSLDPALSKTPKPESGLNRNQTYPAPHEGAYLQERYQPLLDLADHALKRQRLTEPKATSALTYFSLILKEDSGHQAAQAGLLAIIDQYLEWALRAIEDANYADANSFLERAARVNPKSPEIAAMANRLHRKREEGSLIEILPSWIISAQNSASQHANEQEQKQVSTYFQDLAQKVESLAARVSIYSRDDAQGRWLYQQLNAGTPTRLRGTLKIDTPSRIEMHFDRNPSTISN